MTALLVNVTEFSAQSLFLTCLVQWKCFKDFKIGRKKHKSHFHILSGLSYMKINLVYEDCPAKLVKLTNIVEHIINK